MSEFSIHDVKIVEEIYDVDEVNNMLQSGWILLSVGFETIDNESCKVYILGNIKQVKSDDFNQEDVLSKIIHD